MCFMNLQRAAGGGIAVVQNTWNGLMKVGRKVRPSNAQRDFRPLSKEDI